MSMIVIKKQMECAIAAGPRDRSANRHGDFS
jgi:hypothetical protein